MTVKKTNSRWPDKYQDSFPKIIETAEVCLALEKEILHITSNNITRASRRDWFEEIMGMFTVEEFVNIRQFTVPTT